MKRESFHRIYRRWALLFWGVGFLLFLLQGGLLFRSGLEESKSDGDALLLAATHSFSLTLEGELDRASFLAADPERFASLAGELSLFARLEGDRLVQVIRGHLPRGFRLPGRAGMTDRWVISDLLNPDGVPQFVTVRTFHGNDYLLGVRLNTSGLEPFADQNVAPFLTDPRGALLWHDPRDPSGLGVPLEHRGWLDREVLEARTWKEIPLSTGRSVWARTQGVEGARISVLIPVTSVLGEAMRFVYPALLLLALMGGLLLAFRRLWNRRVLPEFRGLVDLSQVLESRLAVARDPEEVSASIDDLSKDVQERLDACRMEEAHSVLASLLRALRVLWRQQEEINAFGEEVTSMNASLEESNEFLRKREQIWGQTLRVARLVKGTHQAREEVAHIAETIKDMLGAFGVVVDRLEGDKLVPQAWSGYEEGLPPEPVKVADSLIGRAVREGLVWAEDVRQTPGYLTLHDSVASEVALGLVHMGRAVGGLTVSFQERRPRDEALLETLTPVASVLAGYLDASRAQQEVRDSYDYLARKLQEITGIYHNETEQHLERIGAYCSRIARDLGREQRDVEDLALFARLHDMGKLKVPREILTKPGALSEEEFRTIQRHTLWGAEIIGDAAWLAMARRICLTHHEKWDGTGYPFGLSGEQIPWEGRIVALADVYDALRSPRAYKPGLSHDEVVRTILRGNDRTRPDHFAPEVLQWFQENHDVMDALYDRYQDLPLG